MTDAGRTEERARQHVLMVDDSLTWREGVAEQLREAGYEVTTAESGEAALDRLTDGLSVDAILMDVIMPGIDGVQTCERIKASAQWRDVPLLMLTGEEDTGSVVRGFAAGADDYIPKSSADTVFMARLRSHLRRRELELQTRRIREEFARREAEERARAAREIAEVRAEMIGRLEAVNAELARSNGELDQFARVVSHDLRSPLRTLAACLERLDAGAADALDERQRRDVAWALDCAQRMSGLLGDLLSYARVGGGEPAMVDVDCDELLALVERDLGERLEASGGAIERPADAPKVRGEPALLAQLFQNLIENGLKYCEADAPRIRIEVEPEGAGWLFAVIDNGIGIPSQHATKIFEPFERLHHREDFSGNGIGLAIVQKIVDRHGGRVWVEPAPGGEGSAFRFTLPGVQG